MVTIAFFHSRGSIRSRSRTFLVQHLRLTRHTHDIHRDNFYFKKGLDSTANINFISLERDFKSILVAFLQLTDFSVTIPWRNISVISTVYPPRLRFVLCLGRLGGGGNFVGDTLAGFFSTQPFTENHLKPANSFDRHDDVIVL